MKLTNQTFEAMIEILSNTYEGWELLGPKEKIWKVALTKCVSDEFLLRIVTDWISTKTQPPKNPAELTQHGHDMIKKGFDSAEIAAEIIIDSARKAYYVTDDFQTFTEEYSNSFASMLGMPTEDAYVIDNIQKRSSNPKVLIMVYDELKGEVRECFTGDAENGVEFLRQHIKKSWNMKADESINDFLISGGNYGELEA